MSVQPVTISLRRRSYSATISCTYSSPLQQGLERRLLRRGGGGHDRVLVDAHQPLIMLGRAGGIADAPAGHGIILGEAAQQQGALRMPGRAGKHTCCTPYTSRS